jgi:ribosomal protein L27
MNAQQPEKHMQTALTLAMNVKAGNIIVRQAADGSDLLESVQAVEIIGAGRMRMFRVECGGKTYSYSDRNTKTVRVVAQ